MSKQQTHHAASTAPPWQPPLRAPSALALVRRSPDDLLGEACLAVLRRPLDRRTRRVFRTHLKRGMRPTEVLLRLRYSAEGRLQNVPVRGLFLCAIAWGFALLFRPRALLSVLRRAGRFVVRSRRGAHR